MDVDAPSVSSKTLAACSSFNLGLPSQLADQQRVDVNNASLGSAYGDPAIVVRCGVPKPDELKPTSRCQRANGVDWFVPEGQIGQKPVDVTMTTVGRSPRIEVRVPKDYWPPTAVMVDLAPTIDSRLRKTGGCS